LLAHPSVREMLVEYNYSSPRLLSTSVSSQVAEPASSIDLMLENNRTTAQKDTAEQIKKILPTIINLIVSDNLNI
jgi:hypothetical protein